MRPKFLFLLLLFPFLNVAQHQDKVDFIHGEIMVRVIPQSKEIKGHVSYKLDVLESIDSIFLDASNMKFEFVNVDGKKTKYFNNGKTITIFKKFKAGKSYELFLDYSSQPKQTVYFLESEFELTTDNFKQGPIGPEKTSKSIIENFVTEIWTQGQGKYTSHWLPSFDDMEEKVEFDLAIIIDEGLEVVANGQLLHNSKSLDSARMWSFDMLKPMSSYLLAFAIGNYDKQELKSKSGIPIENYYYPQDSLKVEPTYRYTKQIFNYLEEEIGFPYPWQNYKQVPVRDFLYAGMENTTATIFSDGYVIDSTAFVDKNYVNVNAHELAHQWFGNLVTEKNGNHHWLHEGFATYYAQLAEKEIFGDDHYYWNLFDKAKELQKVSDAGHGQSLIDPKASSLTFYEKGAWALVILKEKIGGEAFKKGIYAYLDKYQFKNVTIGDFLKEMETASGFNLQEFEAKWLHAKEFPSEQVKTFLMTQNSSIRMFYVSKHIDVESFGQILNEDEPAQYKEALMDEFGTELSDVNLSLALTSSDLKVRQKAIQLLGEISENTDFAKVIKPTIEKLLSDTSYVTIENALFKLWATYPEDRANFLEQTRDIVGLPNKNVRLLWLTLAILTNDYNGKKTPLYFKELSGYASKEYGWEIRMGALQYLNQALGLNDEVLRNLVDAANHHSWQFKKFARNLIDELLRDEDYEARFQALVDELNEEETRYLKTKLN